MPEPARARALDAPAREPTWPSAGEGAWALAAAGLGVFDLDLRRARIRWDERACEILGLEPGRRSRRLGQGLLGVHPEDLRTVRRALLAAILQDGRLGPLEARVRHPEGWRWVMARGGVVSCAGSRGDRRARVLGVVEDVHERKVRELEAASEARAYLETANHNKDTFLAVLGHELRRPLAALEHAVSLQSELGPEDPDNQRATSVIRRQVTHMERLVDDLLDLTRVARGKITLQRELVDFARIVRDVLEDHRPVLAAARIALVERVETSAAFVDGDPERLAQVVGNLLTNEAKFTPAGGHVGIHLHATAEEVTLSIDDDGEGMTRELVEHLFEPFRQGVDGARGGLGLGLALVERLVTLHGGKVEADSPGRGLGSRFAIHLPRRPAPSGAMSEERPSRPASKAPSAPRVLVVDDDRDNAEMLQRLLSKRGYLVAVAGSALEAIERARSLRPEAILSDLALEGGMDGHELARALRREPALRRALLVAISGHAREQDRTASSEAGFDAHLAKPVRIAVLEELLGDRLGER